MSDENIRLKLVAYTSAVSHGFGLPLYGQHQRSNTLYIARCSDPGDHAGNVSGFEPVNMDGVKWLDEEVHSEVAVGDRWRDVFIWNDAAFVGDAVELWALMASFRQELEVAAPLSLLDLAVNCGSDEVAEIGRDAVTYLTSRFGEDRAARWKKSYLKVLCNNAVRKHVRRLDDPAKALFPGTFEVGVVDEEIRISIPSTLFDDEAALQRFVDGLALVRAVAASMDVRLAVGNFPAPWSGHIPDVERPAERDLRPLDFGTVGLWSIGPKSNEISRLIQRSYPEFGWASWEAAGGSGRFPQDNSSSLPDIRFVLVDDDLSPNDVHDTFMQIGHSPLLVLAPIPDRRLPSHYLLDSRRGPDQPNNSHALLDTTLARSPFWWGSERRSYERRVADIIAAAAIVCRDAKAAGAITASRERPILAVGIADIGSKRKSQTVPNLASESSWSSGREPSRNLFEVSYETKGEWPDARHAIAVLEARPVGPDFTSFAWAIMRDIQGNGHRNSSTQLERASIDPDLMREVQFPELACAFLVSLDGVMQRHVLVVAETPGFRQIEFFDRRGWQIVRYTDRTTIDRLLHDPDLRLGLLPDELDHGTIRSSEALRRLAARGADQRDVVVISVDEYKEWIDKLPALDKRFAEEKVRRLRAARQPFEPYSDQLLVMSEFYFSETLAASLLRNIRARRGPPVLRRPAKRGSDLRRCWESPKDGLKRFALVDGQLPPAIVELGPNEVPMQDMFIIDGDYAVRALFQSRVFELWARFVLPVASSWEARFSVSDTFGAFPIAAPFEVRPQLDGTSILIASSAPRLLEELTTEVENQFLKRLERGHFSNWRRTIRMRDDSAEAEELQRLILEFYGLKPGADDLDIIKRLVNMNERLPEKGRRR